MAPGGTTIPGGKPVTAEPGLTPRSPWMTLVPVLVTVVAPRTAKLDSVPSPGAEALSGRADTKYGPTNTRAIIRVIDIERYFILCILYVLLKKINHMMQD
jgi:hypothetical protein